MSQSTQTNIWSGCIGAVVMFLMLSFYHTSEYGRMTNHLTCDKSVENMATLELHKDCDHDIN